MDILYTEKAFLSLINFRGINYVAFTFRKRMHISLKSGVCGIELSNELTRVWLLTFDALRVISHQESHESP